MNVLVTGARGFIGRRVVAALAEAGHEVVCGVSPRASSSEARHVAVDFTHDVDVATWRPRLAGIDCVINTVGVVASPQLAIIHVDTPKALFAAAAECGVQAIQVSALGADEHAQTAFHLTKRAADEALLAKHPFATVVQPSLVFGAGGASARMFTVMATLPLIPVPGGGRQPIQPIHVDDAAHAIAALVGNRAYAGRAIPLVGPEPVTLRRFLAALRRALGLGRARFVSIPLPLASAAASAAGWLGALVNRDTLRMLERGNTADVAATCDLLGRMPRPVAQFVDVRCRDDTARMAKIAWLAELMRVAVAIVWLVTAVVSAGLYPVSDSVALVGRMGVHGAAALVLLYAGVAVDLALGIATLLVRRKILWTLQIAVVLAYTLMITAWLSEFWLHPYGPVVKNLPFLCALAWLRALEER